MADIVTYLGQELPIQIIGTDQFKFPGTGGGGDYDILYEKVEQVELQIVRDRQASLDRDGAIIRDLESLTVRTANTEGRLETEITVRAEQNFALVQRTDLMLATIGQNTAKITEEQTIRANADSALTIQINTQAARVDQNVAAISAETTARITAVSGLAQSIEEMEVRVGGNRAAIEEEITIRANQTSALAQDISTMTTRINGMDSRIDEAYETAVGVDEGASATWSLKAQVRTDGKIVQTGVSLGAAIGKDGETRSEIILMADEIALVSALNAPLQRPFVFDTVSGIAHLDAAFIGEATIDALKLANIMRSVDEVDGEPVWQLNTRTGVEKKISRDGTLKNEQGTGYWIITDTATNVKVLEIDGRA